MSGFLTDRRHESKAVIAFFRGSNVLTWQGGPAVKAESGGGVSGGIASFTDPTNKVPAGLWDIEVPDHPHEYGLPYKGSSPAMR